MLITAGWVLPVSRKPLRNGAVLVERGRIVEVGRADELAGFPGAKERQDFPDCVLMPGLVNAHTHLSLSAMEGLLEPDAFDRWLPRLVKAMQCWRPDDYAASAALGARRCIECGVTVVGDIGYGPESLAAAADAGLGGVFYWEVLGIEAASLYAHLEHMEFPVGPDNDCGDRVRCGLSPHSAYTSGPGLIQAMHEAATELNAPVAVHVAESAAETELLTDGTGPLEETARRMIKGFTHPGVAGVAYLDQLNALDGVTAIHLGHSLPTDIPRLAAAARGVVTCPRSNAFLSNQLPRIERMIRAGIPVGIGTDSAASNECLDLFEEVRVLRKSIPRLSASTLIEMVTSMGAIALGIEERFGILERGMHADLAIFKTGESNSPEEDIVRLGGHSTVEAVMSGGQWRMQKGRLVETRDAAAEKAVKDAVSRAKLALA